MSTSTAQPTSLRVARGSLPQADDAAIFTGAEHGGMPLSMFLLDAPPGSGPQPHRHPYPEVFVIHAGSAVFRLGEDDVHAGTGDIVIAPTGVVHSFTATGQSDLRLTAIHPATRIETEWLTDA